MVVKPSQRLTASQVLNHPWMKEDKNLFNSSLKMNWNSLKSFNNYDKLKKVALTYIASQLSENEITELGKLFKKIDKNGDGVLTIDEMKAGMMRYSVCYSYVFLIYRSFGKSRKIFWQRNSDSNGIN